jgi:hypothetical protein
MAGLDPAIFFAGSKKDARVEPGQGEIGFRLLKKN